MNYTVYESYKTFLSSFFSFTNVSASNICAGGRSVCVKLVLLKMIAILYIDIINRSQINVDAFRITVLLVYSLFYLLGY